MQVCSKCGELNRNSKVYCTRCGNKLDPIQSDYDTKNNDTKYSKEKINTKDILINGKVCNNQFNNTIASNFGAFCCPNCRSIYYYENVQNNITIKFIKSMYYYPDHILKAAKILNIDKKDLLNCDVKNSYRKIIEKYHPDKLNNLGDELIQLAKEKTQEINEAYSILKKWKEENEK